jgi:hypothetical protein
MRNLPTRLALTALAVVAVVATTFISNASGIEPAGVASIRSATAKYHDVNVALADGYIPVSPCEASPAGMMGIHYLNPALVGGPIDPLHPQLLLYLPTADGLELVGVEYFRPDADQNLSTSSDRPSLLGQPFNGPMVGHNPQMPIHYDLHVWLWKHNPAGMFAIWNPALSC